MIMATEKFNRNSKDKYKRHRRITDGKLTTDYKITKEKGKTKQSAEFKRLTLKDSPKSIFPLACIH